MKRKPLLVVILVLLTVLLAVVLSFLQFWGAARTFEVRGRVAGFSQDGRTVIVEHEAIEGYMPAMTMPFTARAPGEIEDLQVGDAVAFTLAVDQDSSWIYGIAPLPDSAVARHPAGGMSKTEEVVTSGGIGLLEEGDKVPGFQLTDQSGEPVRLSDYRGQALVLTFIYTRCPLPNYCPLMSRRFAQLQERFQKRFGHRAELLSISFDPAYDTPQVLRRYGKNHGADFDTWTFATGKPKELGRITARLGVFTQKSGSQIIHNLTTALIGPDGRIREIWRGNDWKPSDVTKAVAEVLGD